MTFDAASEIARELEPNERLLWLGTPFRDLKPRWIDVIILAGGGIFITVMLCVGSGLILLQGTYEGIVPCAIGITVATALACYYLLFNPWQRARTCYAVTDKRAILIYRFWRQRILRSVELDSIIQVRFTQHPFGGASIMLDARRHGLEHADPRIGFIFFPREPTFELIPDPLAVSNLLDEVRKKPKSALEPVQHGE